MAAFEPELPAGEALPEWIEAHRAATAELPALAAELAAGTGPAESSWFFAGRTLPFHELALPHLRAAKRELLARAGAGWALLSAAAQRAIDLRLLEDSVAVGIAAWYERFDAVRSLGRLVGGPPPAGFYRAFVRTEVEGALTDFLAEHPGLARQLAQLALSWVGMWGDFLTRLAADLPALTHTFGGPLLRVAELRTALSDRHRGGRSVVGITFETGRGLIYKPRPVDQEAAFNRLLGWLAERSPSEAPARLRVLARPGYGWVERVEHAPAPDRATAERWFRQAGALLALADALRADDLHADNVIMTAAGPTLVDVETFFQPAASAAGDAWDHSALRSQLLTNPRLDARGKRHDDGGFAPGGGEVREKGRRFWKGVGTDELGFELRDVVAAPGANTVRLGGEVLAPRAFGREIRAGYAATYRLLLAERAALATPEGPLAPFRDTETRLLLRPSNVYAVLSAQVATPRYQRRPLLASLLIDALNRAFDRELQPPRLWPLVAGEQQALIERDIPLFTLPVTATALCTARGERVEGAFALSGWEAVHRRLGALSEEDLDTRLRELEAALPPPLPSRVRGAAAESIPDRLLAAALAVGEHLLEAGNPAPRTTAELTLYNGLAGRGLFFAALARQTEKPAFRSAALRSADQLAEALAGTDAARFEAELSPGVARGWGGLLYAADRMAELLGEGGSLAPLVLAGLEGAAARAEGEAHLKAEVADGAAGALLALLASPRLATSDEVRGLAERYAALLAEHPLSAAGFAHGAAGTALALRLASRVLGNPALLAAAEAANAAERLAFSKEAGNWPVTGAERSPGKPVFMVAWCHGAVGVGLGRVGELAAGADGLARADLAAAVKAAAAAPESPVDHLCCGNLGRLELLLEAGLALGKPGLIERAQHAAAQGLTRVEREGGFRLDPATPHSEPTATTGFFRGLAGIGYQLLRLAQPGELPSVLRFEGVAAIPLPGATPPIDGGRAPWALSGGAVAPPKAQQMP